MRVACSQDSIQVAALSELGASNAGSVRDEVIRSITSERAVVEVDLSETVYVDSAGLGALLAIHKEASKHGGSVRVLSPSLQVQQVLELTRMHLLLEIVPSQGQSIQVTSRKTGETASIALTQ